MHDIRAIRDDPDGFAQAMARRGQPDDTTSRVLELDTGLRAAQTALGELGGECNANARLVGLAMREGNTDQAAQLRLHGRELAARLGLLRASAGAAEVALAGLVEALPNRLAHDVAPGMDEGANVVLATHGEARPGPAPHWEFGQGLGLDAAGGASLAGARSTLLRGGVARLERALGQFMLDLHTGEHGYEAVAPPLMVLPEIARGTGQLPKFSDDLFWVGTDRLLIPTAEVALTNMVRGQTLDPAHLPLRLVALTPCFRKEAGAAGRDTRGYLRQHQFNKVELVSVVAPEDGDAEHQRMTACAERVLELLGLAWRRVGLCTGDTGFSAARTFDLEVWMAGQREWREISSCSTCTDFQSRRMGTRLKGRPELPHTLNGSGVAVGRALVAVLEANLGGDGRVTVPPVLRPYMGGLVELVPVL